MPLRRFPFARFIRAKCSCRASQPPSSRLRGSNPREIQMMLRSKENFLFACSMRDVFALQIYRHR